MRFVLPRVPQVIESRADGPLWSFAVRLETGQPSLMVLAPAVGERPFDARLARDGRTLAVMGEGWRDTIVLPGPGCADRLPALQCTGRRVLS